MSNLLNVSAKSDILWVQSWAKSIGYSVDDVPSARILHWINTAQKYVNSHNGHGESIGGNMMRFYITSEGMSLTTQ